MVETEETQLAEKAHRKNLDSAKSKTTRRKPSTATSQAIKTPDELLKENEEVALFTDGASMSSLEFLTNPSHDVCYRSAARLVPAGHKSAHERV